MFQTCGKNSANVWNNNYFFLYIIENFCGVWVHQVINDLCKKIENSVSALNKSDILKKERPRLRDVIVLQDK